ncbi:MAG: signal peptidase I [Phycisphaeraceae bacterium]|nr:signal peptidase I [Phycisphaeraceae bacterium]
MPDTTSTSPPPSHLAYDSEPLDQSIKETLQSIVLAFVLAFLFRSFVVEAFIIPTGSMAPTLLGRHLSVTDPTTGYGFSVNPTSEGASTLSEFDRLGAPMSAHVLELPKGSFISPGDRILVLKYLYAFQEPQRWDVVVFKNPTNPNENYIKRLVGLPGESIWIVDGNIYVRRPDQPSWQVARKLDRRHGERIQRAVWQPIYYSQFVSLPWASQETPATADQMQSPPFVVPWIISQGQWKLDEFHQLDASHGYHLLSPQGQLHFDFDTGVSPLAGLYSYNQTTRGPQLDQPVEDIRLAATIVPHQTGLSFDLQTTSRLDNADSRQDRLIARFQADGSVLLLAVDPQQDATRVLAGPIQVGPFMPEVPHRVELWYVDQQASIWIDGQPVVRWSFSLPIDDIVRRPPPPSRPQVAIHIRGCPTSLYEVTLDRDLFYTSESSDHNVRPQGTLVKDEDLRLGEPIELQADQFFCLGDNSPLSQDGRFWSDPNAWVQQRYFDQDATPNGIVPRRLLMGRAFFVYWPAPLALSPNQLPVLPNFADMRWIY